jgi:D-alanyl-D-alanine carboxypeptidase
MRQGLILTSSARMSVVALWAGLALASLFCDCATGKYRFPQTAAQDPRNTVQANLGSRLETVLEDCVISLNIPGIQACVVFDDGRRWQGVAGTTTFQRDKLMEAGSLFRIASATKFFTAIVIMKYVEQGKFSLSDPLAKWFPDIKAADKITVEMLLNHTSGLPDTFEDFGALLASGLNAHKVWTAAELVKVHGGKHYFEPGTNWRYSNFNYMLLGMIAEKISGKDFGAILHEELLDPLSLTETYYPLTEKVPSALVPGFDRSLMPYPNTNASDNTAWASLAAASGAIVSTATDMASLASAFFNDRILGHATVERMLDFKAGKNPGSAWTGYGLGVVRAFIDGVEYWGHEGLFIGFESYVLYCPKYKFTIAIVGNTSRFDQESVIAELSRIASTGP